jgi:hypothetical protein
MCRDLLHILHPLDAAHQRCYNSGSHGNCRNTDPLLSSSNLGWIALGRQPSLFALATSESEPLSNFGWKEGGTMESPTRFLAGQVSILVAALLAVVWNSGAQITARPAIADLSPNAAAAGTPDLTLTVTGTGFVPAAPSPYAGPLPGAGSLVQWNDNLLKTTYQSDTKLTAVVPAQSLTTPARVSVSVVNPGQLVSNAVTFIVNGAGSGGTSLPLAIATAVALPNGTVGAAYIQTLTAAGGSPPYTWSIGTGSLPPNLTLMSSTGLITGTPTTPGTFSFTAQVTDSVKAISVKGLSLTITSPGTVALAIATPSSLPDAIAARPYSQTLTASGGTPPYSWSIVDGLLPPGLRLDSSSGLAFGTAVVPGTFNFTVQVSDSARSLSIKSLVIVVAPLPPLLAIATPAPLPGGTVGQAYSTTLSAVGGKPPYVWALKAGSLPAGLILDSSAGLISGIPTVAGTSNLTAQVTDADRATASSAYVLTIDPRVSISAVLNAASLLPGPISPGVLISIFGSEIGPATPVNLRLNSSGSVDTLLADTRVLVDGLASPLISVQARQINTVVPYRVAGRATYVVEVEFQGVRSKGFVVTGAGSSPAVFTRDSSGKGPGAILNEDGTRNSV